MQVHPRAPQTLTDASVSVEPTRTRSRPPFFASDTCSAASTATFCGSSGSSTSAADFASQAVWGVVITTIVVAVGLVVALIYIKRRVRRRNRERIRGLLWELVQAVQEGRVDESRLQQAIYGVDPEFMQLNIPKMYEVYLDSATSPDSISKSVLLEKSSQAPWDELTPLSMSHLRGPIHVGKNAETGGKTSSSKRPHVQSGEQNLDIAVLIVMPHERKGKELLSLLELTSSQRPTNLPTTTDSMPVTLATASPRFQEDPVHPVVPIERPNRRRIDGLSSVGAPSLAQRAASDANRDDPLTSVGRSLVTR